MYSPYQVILHHLKDTTCKWLLYTSHIQPLNIMLHCVHQK